MSSQANLELILNELKFTAEERDAFLLTTKIARDYMKDSSIDLEKQFREIVEKVVPDEV